MPFLFNFKDLGQRACWKLLGQKKIDVGQAGIKALQRNFLGKIIQFPY